MDGTEMLSQTVSVDGEIIRQLRTDWEEEYLEASGSAPVLERYDDAERNRGLARLGALTAARAGLAEQVGSIQVTERITMNDLAASQFVQTRLEAVLQNVEIVEDRYDEPAARHVVTIRMPKVSLVRVVEEAVR